MNNNNQSGDIGEGVDITIQSEEKTNNGTRDLLLKRVLMFLRKSIVTYLGRIIVFSFLATFSLIITILIGLNQFPPGFLLNIPNIFVFLLIPFLLAYLLTPHNRQSIRFSNKQKQLSRKQKVLYICLMILIGASGLVFNQIQSNAENSRIKTAQDHFEYLVYGQIQESRIESTLIELETQYERLVENFDISLNGEKIHTVMYSDIDILRQTTGLPEWSDGFITFESEIPVIHVVAVQANTGSSKTNQFASPTSGHELTHYFVYRLVGRNQFTEVPRWFSEGIAQYESTQKWTFWIGKSFIKYSLWSTYIGYENSYINEKRILSDSGFTEEHINTYYVVSWQFAEYLFDKYNVYAILQGVSDGLSFQDAVESETGETPEILYDEWLRYYF